MTRTGNCFTRCITMATTRYRLTWSVLVTTATKSLTRIILMATTRYRSTWIIRVTTT
jgi:hypothetical protein